MKFMLMLMGAGFIVLAMAHVLTSTSFYQASLYSLTYYENVVIFAQLMTAAAAWFILAMVNK